jgi:DNA-binding transcriptional ArsR family regulator
VKTYQDRFEALGDRTRWAIVERLARGPLSVRQLADDLPVSRPAVSQHLKVLGEAGLVTSVPGDATDLPAEPRWHRFNAGFPGPALG